MYVQFTSCVNSCVNGETYNFRNVGNCYITLHSWKKWIIILPSLFFINVDCSLTVIGLCLVLCVTMEKRLPCFCHFLFIVFSIVTLTTGFCMLQKSKQHPFLVISDYFHKIFNEIWIKNTEMSGQKD